jgi:hypothetical protein
MSVDIVENYCKILAESMKTKQFETLLSSFASEFDVSASLMGKSYEFNNAEKFKKFLENIPSGIEVKINKILSNDDGSYTAKVAMGMGFMKMPGKWHVELDSDLKIKTIKIT